MAKYAPKWAQNRDKNEKPLFEHARALGWLIWDEGPFDAWGCYLRQWFPIEIKDPKKEGWAAEYTKKQKKLMGEIQQYGGRLLSWRTLDDVERDSNARRSA